jgi:ubiquinone biosynthesis accessory factor UbiJ
VLAPPNYTDTMVDRWLNDAAVVVLNRMLAHEPWARDKLAPFAGRVARFDVVPFALRLAIAEGGMFEAAGEAEPSVTIELAIGALPLALFDPQAAMRDVKLEGDAEFAQALSFVLQNLKPEPEEELARFVGDAAAVRIVGFLRLSASHWRQLAERMLDSTAQYIVTENPMVIGREEAAAFAQEVSRLRDDVARFEKRVDRAARG